MTNTLNWHYKPDDLSANNDKMLAEGDYRVCINSVFPTVAKNGTEGLEITYDVNGYRKSLKHYIWLNRNNVQRTNQALGQFFNSFDIDIIKSIDYNKIVRNHNSDNLKEVLYALF